MQGKASQVPDRYDGLLSDTDSPTVHDFLAILRRTHIPDWVQPGRRRRIIAGKIIKGAARIVAGYADYVTDDTGRRQGHHAHPPIGEIAVDLQISYRDAQECMKALAAFKVVEMTEDNRKRNLPSEYRLLNLMCSGLVVLDPAAFQEAGRQARLKDKGPSRKAPAKLAAVVQLPLPPTAETIKTRGASGTPGLGGPGGEPPPGPGGERHPPPLNDHSALTTQKPRAAFLGTDRAHETPEEDHPKLAAPTNDGPPNTPTATAATPRIHHSRPVGTRRRRAWVDDGTPEPARYRNPPDHIEPA